MINAIVKDKIRYFLLGIAIIFAFIVLTGISKTPPPNYGRYQISSFAAAIENNGSIIGAFVVDTATGETKTVYSRTFKRINEGQILINNLKKPFITMD